MTQSDIEAAKAAFLARGGTVQSVSPAAAYGVDPASDKTKHLEARRAARSAWDHAQAEHEAENAFQRGVEENGYYKS